MRTVGIWVGKYIRLRVRRRRDVWRVVQMRRHLGLVMALRDGMGKGKYYSGPGLSQRMNELMWQEKLKTMGVEKGKIGGSSIRVT